AGMPAVSVCMGCHAQIRTQSPQLEPVRNAYAGTATLAWRRVTRLPDFVFFDHSAHVTHGVGCPTCHGDVAHMARVYAVETFTMKFCLDCHRAPRIATTADDYDWAAPSSAEQQRYFAKTAAPGTDCSTCHR